MTFRIVFDLDGTLIDSAPHIHHAANQGLAAHGLDQITLDQARSFVGRGLPVFIERARAALELPEDMQAPLEASVLDFYEGAAHLNTPYPNVVAVLEKLAGRGDRLGICTNKPIGPTRTVLNHLGLSQMFGVILGGDSMEVRKPDPAPLVAAFDALGSAPQIYVGDSEVDAETAKRARVPFLLFTEGYRSVPVEDLPHAAPFSDFDALPGLIAKHAKKG
ncbi:MAG: phosphoglycolate phosphatase [Paracoccaceae bacterium]